MSPRRQRDNIYLLRVPIHWVLSKHAVESIINIVRPPVGCTHWALQIRDRCYHLTSAKGCSSFASFLCSTHKPKSVPYEDWYEDNEDRRGGLRPLKRKVGQTVMPHREIESAMKQVWRGPEFEKTYDSNNGRECQTFAQALFREICIPSESVSKGEFSTWRYFPNESLVYHRLEREFYRSPFIGQLYNVMHENTGITVSQFIKILPEIWKEHIREWQDEEV
ncbi:hypothetical protein BKA66DRAFT_582719 [Pyrenochaeta sp. MPI-SDFR-AT-0127]|nr:hypothetical protein BKA66DRAFT_582719 [Pyrenochaeta sp. MPI-SDFR-AT-0127]